MAEERMFEAINGLLASEGCPDRVKSLSELKGFLNHDSNKRYDVYGQVEEMYYALVLGSGMW
jgi:hypothetical protein